MDNFDAFKELLDSNDLNYYEDEFDDGDRVLKIPQRLQHGAMVNVVVLFGKFKVKVALLGLATIEEEDKQFACYKLFNDFNREYAFFKMYIRSDGNICVDADFSLDLVEGEFQSEELMRFVAMMLHTVDKVYRDIMKIQWT